MLITKEEEDFLWEYREEEKAFFASLGVFQPIVKPSVKKRLTKKLAEYRKRIEKWEYDAPSLKIRDPNYRYTRFKLLLMETVLNATADVSIVKLAEKEMGELDHFFFADEFFNACAMVSVYLGTPFEGVTIIE